MSELGPILIVEDEPNDVELTLAALEEYDLAKEVVVTRDGQEALDYLHRRGKFNTRRNGNPAIMLLDLNLPKVDGIEVLQQIKSDEHLQMMPVVVLTSGTFGEDVGINALKIGATDYILKTRLSRLASAVQNALREARERAERKKAEEALRRSEMYLAEAQRLSHTGSFGWDVSTGEIYWSTETFRIFECEPATKPTLEMIIELTHPDDRAHLRQVVECASVERSGFAAEPRLMRIDGSVKYVRVVAQPAAGEDPRSLLFIGAVTDITERKRAAEERERLRQLEADLAHTNRVSMMGELAASLAHEIKQPIAAAVLDSQTCTQWLRRDAPNVTEASKAASAMAAAAKRAAEIIDRVSSLYRRGTPERELVDLNEIVREMSVLLSHTANRNAVSIHTDLDPELPTTTADRIQLQQVLMNLMLNGIEAMHETGGELTVASKRSQDGQLLVSVSDAGIGLSTDEARRIFEAFFTTKPRGTGMGLSISRRIVESHGGRLWATPNTGRGATFQFTLPVEATASSAVAV
jgi:signal transduction histidine kinase/CheY-like chemotaxis protein